MTANGSNSDFVLRAAALTRIYQRGCEQVRALDHVDFEVRRNEFIAVVGPSGAGKTTLLHLAGFMDSPTSGKLELLGRAVSDLTESERTRMRREAIGFVFQHFSLLPTLTVAENVALPALFARRPCQPRANELLDRVGLSHRSAHRPSELSGGEMQRAAIARALINQPALLLADEPTGNLDLDSTHQVLELFHRLNREGLTIVLVTHNPLLEKAAGRTLRMASGKVETDGLAVGKEQRGRAGGKILIGAEPK